MSRRHSPSDLPVGGLAQDLIPLLRQRLALGGNASAAPPTESNRSSPALTHDAFPAGSILEFATAAAAAAPDNPPTAPLVQLITFAIGIERYALPIDLVYEILRVTPITRVPHAPRAIRGLMNVRGRLLPVVEVRTLFDMEPGALDKEARVITVQVRGRNLGLLVDRVGYVAKVRQDCILPAPPEIIGSKSHFVAAVASDAAGLVVVFDLERAFQSDWRNR
jgi:purine-binding chemotaxis protein CheW